jgi:hypothetical protein
MVAAARYSIISTANPQEGEEAPSGLGRARHRRHVKSVGREYYGQTEEQQRANPLHHTIYAVCGEVPPAPNVTYSNLLNLVKLIGAERREVIERYLEQVEASVSITSHAFDARRCHQLLPRLRRAGVEPRVLCAD